MGNAGRLGLLAAAQLAACAPAEPDPPMLEAVVVEVRDVPAEAKPTPPPDVAQPHEVVKQEDPADTDLRYPDGKVEHSPTKHHSKTAKASRPAPKADKPAPTETKPEPTATKPLDPAKPPLETNPYIYK